MIVNLRYIGWRDYRPWRAKSGSKEGSLAWCDRSTNIVYVRHGAATLTRLGHELEHLLDPAFGNADHHHWSCFCIRSYGPFRRWRHNLKAKPEMARSLKRYKQIYIPDSLPPFPVLEV